MSKFVSLSALVLILTGCGSPDGSTWLIKTSSDVISVAEVGAIWNELDQDTKIRFLSANNPVGDFITALGRKTMITTEMDNDSCLYSPMIQDMKECWIINSAFIACIDTLSASTRRNLTEPDLSNYRKLLGSVVWYSSETSGSKGPERLPDLPWALAFAFDSMATGTSVEIEGITYTLDSTVTSPREMIDETIADSARFNDFARTSLVESRVNRYLLSLKTEVLDTFTADTATVSAYCSQRESLDNSAELASWRYGSINAGEFDGIAAFVSLGQPGNEHSLEWVLHSLRNQARLTYIADLYAAEFPEEFSSFEAGAEAFAVDQASELLFKTNVTDVVQITDSMVYEAYIQMDSIPLLPETRVFESVMVPGNIVDDAIVLLDNDNALLELGYTGYTKFLRSGNEFLSRAVYPSELPYEMDLTLFLLEEGDTQWQKPVETEECLFVFYRLVEIIPPHAASFEQMEASIARNLQIHLEEQRTMEWMCELEAKHQFQVNHGILSDLPADPANWSEL